MSYIQTISVTILIIFILFSGCIEEERKEEEPTENIINLTISDNISNVTVETGDKINITLEQNRVSNGYSWNIVEIDENIIELESNRLWGESDLIGSTMYETWIFNTLNTGSATIKVSYYRPWEGVDNATKNFSVNIKVEDDTNQTTNNLAYLKLKIGDRPTDDFEHVNITFSEIKIHSNDTGWQTIPLVNKNIDLLYLHKNNLNETLGVTNLTVANYTKLWIVVDNATGILSTTNEKIDFEIPSSILKIQQLFNLLSGDNTIVVDIDLDNSILVTKNKYKILPVISDIRHFHKNKVKFQNDEINVEQSGRRSDNLHVYENENITFTAASSDLSDQNLSYVWDFGDGTNSTEIEVNHSYSDSGSYWVQLKTIDDGEESITFIHVIVKKRK